MNRIRNQEIHLPDATVEKAVEEYLRRNYFSIDVKVVKLEKPYSTGDYVVTVDINQEIDGDDDHLKPPVSPLPPEKVPGAVQAAQDYSDDRSF